ncbi:MAG: nuclear transport factor 2 family protein [Solirubrobacteraceae bacterium]
MTIPSPRRLVQDERPAGAPTNVTDAWDRVEIDAVINRFAVGLDQLYSAFPVRLDSAALNAVFECFIEDGLLASPFSRTEGRDAIREAWARVATTESGAGAPKYLRHHLTSRSTVLEGSTTARSTVYFQGVTDRGLDHWGYTEYLMVRLAEGWKFAEQFVTVQGFLPGGFYAALVAARGVRAEAGG